MEGRRERVGWGWQAERGGETRESCAGSSVFPVRWLHITKFPYMLLRRALRLATPFLLPLQAHKPHKSITRPLCMTNSNNKRSMVKIGTHSGAFHCDEALGCFLLKQLDQYKDAEVVRTRDAAVLKEMDVVVDVGGVYDPGMRHPCTSTLASTSLYTSLSSTPTATLRFDHHQREFADVFGHGFSTRLSSAGLVYKHFGKDVIAKITHKKPDAPEVHLIWLAVYKHFMEAVDAIDNGINQWEGDATPKYINSTHLSARVGGLNPAWNQDQSDAARLEGFSKAMEMTGREFVQCVEFYTNCWLPARQYVEVLGGVETGYTGVDVHCGVVHASMCCCRLYTGCVYMLCW